MSEDLNFTDSTNISLGENDKRKLSFDFSEHFMQNSYHKNINQRSEFTEPDYPLIMNDVLQKAYKLKQDILRVWLVLRCFDFILLMKNKGHYPIIHIKGQDTWQLGNQFKGNFYGKYPFVAKVRKVVNYPEIKIIEWIFHLGKDQYFTVKLEFFQVTEDNSTVVNKKVKYNKDKFNFEEVVKDIHEIKIFKTLENILENEPINLLKYESGVIGARMEVIWNIIVDFNKIIAIAPNNNFLPNISIKDLKIGEKSKASIIGTKNDYRNFDFTVLFREEKKNWNKWQILIEASGGYPKMIPKHTLLLQLTKINDNECQLTLLTKFHEPIDNEEFKELSNRKKYIILCLKDYFDNFYTPSSVE